MAITVTFNEYNGAAETKTSGITSLTFGASDAASFTAHEYPLYAGQRSFVKYVTAEFAGFGGETISATKVYCDSTMSTGESLTYEGLGPVAYATPTDGTDETSEDSAIPTSEPGEQNLALGDADDGTLVADGESNLMRFQRTMGATTPNGTLNTLTITLAYTEA